MAFSQQLHVLLNITLRQIQIVHEIASHFLNRHIKQRLMMQAMTPPNCGPVSDAHLLGNVLSAASAIVTSPTGEAKNIEIKQKAAMQDLENDTEI